MTSFMNKVAAITGSGSGIGRALALDLARHGCHLALSDVNEAGLKETAELARQQGVKVLETKLDVSDRKAVFAWADEVARHFGKINMIFNNAGVAVAGTVDGSDFEDYEWIVNINFWGVVNGTKAFLPYLKATRDGHVINTSSVFGLQAQPGMSAYNATKFAVRGFTEALRQELDLENCGVSSTCVHPGGIRTNIAKAARMNDSMNSLSGGTIDIETARSKFNDLLLRTTPEQAAKTILRGVQFNRRRVLIGADAHILDITQRLLPTGYQGLTVAIFRCISKWGSRLMGSGAAKH